MVSDDFPAVSTRPGARVLGTFGASVWGMAVFGNTVHAIFSDGTWRMNSLSGSQSSWQIVKTGLSNASSYYFASYIGNLSSPEIFLAGEPGPLQYYDGFSTQPVSGSPTNAKGLVVYQNRLWTIVGNELRACAVDDQNTWDRFNGGAGDSYGKQLEFPDGKPATGMFANSTSLVITSTDSMFELTGSDPTNFTLRLLTPEAGASTAEAGTTLAGISYFYSDRGIYEYSGGILPSRGFSEIARKFSKNVSLFGSAGTDGENIYFTSLGGVTLVYDARANIQAWSKWSGLNPRYFAPFYSSSAKKMSLLMGTYDGKILAMDADMDTGSPIPWSVTTIPFTNASIASKQRLYKLFVSIEYTGSVQIYLSNKITGEDFELVASATGTNAVETRRFIIPVAKYTRENYIRIRISGQGRAKIHEIARHYRQLPVY